MTGVARTLFFFVSHFFIYISASARLKLPSLCRIGTHQLKMRGSIRRVWRKDRRTMAPHVSLGLGARPPDSVCPAPAPNRFQVAFRSGQCPHALSFSLPLSLLHTLTVSLSPTHIKRTLSLSHNHTQTLSFTHTKKTYTLSHLQTQTLPQSPLSQDSSCPAPASNEWVLLSDRRRQPPPNQELEPLRHQPRQHQSSDAIRL